MQKENEQVLLYVSKNNELAIKVPQNPVLAKQIQKYLQEKCGLKTNCDNNRLYFIPSWYDAQITSKEIVSSLSKII